MQELVGFCNFYHYTDILVFSLVPVSFYSSNDDIDHLFESVNGFFFPGGGMLEF